MFEGFLSFSKTLEPQISKQQISNRSLRWELESNNLEGARLVFNLTCRFFNLRGSVFISKQTPRQRFLQNIWSVIWPNIYTPENYFAGIQLWVVFFFAYFSYWLFSVFSYIALVEAVRFAWSLYLNWWWDRGPQGRQMYFFLVDEFAWYRLYAEPFTEVLCWKRYVHSVWQAEFAFELVWLHFVLVLVRAYWHWWHWLVFILQWNYWITSILWMMLRSFVESGLNLSLFTYCRTLQAGFQHALQLAIQYWLHWG